MSLDLSLEDIIAKHRALWNYISEYYAEAYKIYNHFERIKNKFLYGDRLFYSDSTITETQYRLFERYKKDIIKACFCITDNDHEYLNLVNNCFLCDYTSRFGNHKDSCCDLCPCLDPTDGERDYGCLDGLYLDFVDACYNGKFKKASKLAKKIAKLPEYVEVC